MCVILFPRISCGKLPFCTLLVRRTAALLDASLENSRSSGYVSGEQLHRITAVLAATLSPLSHTYVFSSKQHIVSLVHMVANIQQSFMAIVCT